MTLPLEFRPSAMTPAQALYRKSEFALAYTLEQPPQEARSHPVQSRVDADLGISVPKWLVIADTLVMVFSGPGAEFVTFDAYTNIDHWRTRADIPDQDLIGVGSVGLGAPPRDTDRIDLAVVPQFYFSPSQSRLLITLGREGLKHYKVSTCLVLGLDDEGLASLQVNDLTLS